VDLPADGLILHRVPIQEVLALDHGLARVAYDTADYPRLIGFLLIRDVDRTVVGSLMLERERRDPTRIWIDFAIVKSERRRGYCKKAVARVAAWARNEGGASQVLAEILDTNVPSQSCAAKAGFVQTAEQGGQVWEYRGDNG
jgi:RimJ/RimL family protein N-acetyltransferase